MINVAVEITKIVDESFPIFVEAVLIDINGTEHYFLDKLPVFSASYNVSVPCIGEMRCEIVQNKRTTMIVDTSSLDDIESINGEFRFEVLRNQIIKR